MDTEMRPILAEGRNCWVRAPAERIKFLVDAAAYYEALGSAIRRARRSIVILGWDVHSRTTLSWDADGNCLCDELGAALSDALAREPRLEVHVLCWDFIMLYAFDREALPKFRWRTHRRLHFRLDAAHPAGASHHQKVVVIDDRIAFAGGIDVCGARWDTPEHRGDDPRRLDPRGKPYPPFHDLMMAVDGDAARRLGDLARERWLRLTGHRIERPFVESDPWPPGLAPDLRNETVAIARTEPAFAGRPEVREVEALTLDAIASAKRHIYIENQYFTAARVGEAMMARLQERDGPDIVVVTSRDATGWLEEVTMGVLRARLLRQLHAADRYGRFRIYHPVVPGLGERCFKVHSKLLIVDDRLVRIGSSNLNNRSMGLDTECDLAIEGKPGTKTAAAIAGLRNRLLGEHLGVAPEIVARELERSGSLAATVESLRSGERTLQELDGETSAWLDEMIPDSAVVDPERALRPDEWREVLPEDVRERGHRPFLRGAFLVFVVVAILAIWHWTPLRSWAEPNDLAAAANDVESSRLAPLAVLAAYVAGSFLMIPVNFLILGTALAFDPAASFAYAFLGCLLSAAATYAVGRTLGSEALGGLAGARWNEIRRRLRRSGVLAVAVLRLLPIAPFTIVNVVAGASNVGFRDYVLGTALGMLPGIVLITSFEYGLEASMRQPNPAGIAVLAALAAVLGFAAAGVRRFLQGKSGGERARGAGA